MPAFRPSCSSRSSTGGSSCVARSSPSCGRALLELRARRPQPFRDDKAIASWNGLALAAIAESARRLDRDDWLRAARELGEFLLGPLSADDGRLLRSVRDGTHERLRLPGRLRERRVRPHGAPRRDRRAPLAPRGAPTRVARRRALRGRGARRLLPLERRRRRARSPDEGPPGHAGALRELDARAGCSCGSGGSGATTSSRRGPYRSSASSSRRSSGRRERSRGRSAGSISGSALLGRSRSPGRSARPSPEPRSRRSSRGRWSRSARRRTCPCWPGRTSSTASRPSTSASASSARLPVTDPVELEV